MKICFFTGDITRSGGTERVVSTLTDGLINENTTHELFILSLEQGTEEPFYAFDNQIMLANLGLQEEMTSTQKFAKGVRGLRRFIKKHQIDLLIDVDTLLSVYSVPAIALTKVKHLSWEHFTFNQNLGVRYRNWGRKLAGRFADGIVVLTNQDRELYLMNKGIKRPVYHIYNPIVLNDTARKPEDAEHKIIFSAGRLTYQKGFDLLIDVAERVFERHPDWQWLIAGEGEDREQLEQKIKEKQLEKQVLLVGNVNNIDAYYQAASIFVLTSRFEPFGLVLTEAKAHHLPCVSFDVESGPAEIILDPLNGYLIDAFDVADMAEKINTLIEQPALRKEQSEQAMVGTDKFQIENITVAWENIFATFANETSQK